jgi:hypothetical protein
MTDLQIVAVHSVVLGFFIGWCCRGLHNARRKFQDAETDALM